MKKALLLGFLLLTFSFSAISQGIPNSGFEVWGFGPDTVPDGWSNHRQNIPDFNSITRSSDYQSGTYSVRIENKISGSDVSYGELSTTRPDDVEGFGPAFPVSQRHTFLKGFYKFTPDQGDSAQIMAFLYKTDYQHSGGFGNILAYGYVNLGAAATFTMFTAPLQYDNDTLVADSGYINMATYMGIDFAGGSFGLEPLGNSVLYVDDLSFDSPFAINDKSDTTNNFKLFPSLNNGSFNISFKAAKTELYAVKIYNMLGKEVQNLFNGCLNVGEHQFHYDTPSLKNGTYLFVISNESGYKVEKFIIQK